jgi:hypothetical protein
MRNPYPITKSLLALAIVGVSLSACKDDDNEPTPRTTVSFEKSTVSAGEGSGVLTVNIVLDRAAAEDMTVSYTLAGTAVDKLTAASSGATADYEIIGDHGEVDIKKGETSGGIEIQIVSDGTYEGNETIDITLDDVDVDNVDIAENNTTKVTILDDEDEGDVVQISFDESSIITSEDARDLSVLLTLSKAAPEKLTLSYTLAGNALDSMKAFDNDASRFTDYYVVNGEDGKIVIEKGATTAKIDLHIYSDFFLENDETIEISLTSNSVAAQVAPAPAKIQLNQEDGRAILLFWNAEAGVDMDLLLWAADPGEDLGPFVASAFPDTEGAESIIIPDALDISDADFGLSFIYYSGTVDDLGFSVVHVTFADGDFLEDDVAFDATYTLDNINNTWDQQSGQIPFIAQTFYKTDGAYVDISNITVAEDGSRRPSLKALPAKIRDRSDRLKTTLRSYKR